MRNFLNTSAHHDPLPASPLPGGGIGPLPSVTAPCVTLPSASMQSWQGEGWGGVMFLKIIYILLMAISLIACDPQSNKTESAKNSILKPCPGFTETGYPPLVDGAECGELLVSENPDDPQSQKISLNILRLPAISPAPEKDPVFLIQGGPGGSSVEMAKQIHMVFYDVRKNRDLIFVDQRGTGKSNPLKCKKPPEELNQWKEKQQREWMDAEMQRCADEFRTAAIFYTTPYAVQDLDAVRSALGYESINLWGGSYGTRVVIQYARQFPKRLRSMVMDGVAPVDIALPDYFARDAMQSLNKINEQCLKNPDCVSLYGNILEKIDIIMERLKRADAEQRTVTIQYRDPQHNQAKTWVLNQHEFSSLIFAALYSRDLSALLPQIISDAEKEQYQALISLNSLATKSFGKLEISDAMRYSVVCNEDRSRSAKNQQLQKFLEYNFVEEMDRVCAIWPKTNLPSDYYLPLKTDIPALLLSGEFDPVTPVSWAELVNQGLTHSLSLLAPGGHHIVSTEGCVPQLIAQFYERASTENLEANCVQNILPLPMDLGANRDNKTQDGGEK
jgi:pimeloyl-ACP methyl ester carboxylesterase